MIGVSLKYLLEKTEYESKEYSFAEDYGNRYSGILLYEGKNQELYPNTLYVSAVMPDEVTVKEEQIGFFLIHIKERDKRIFDGEHVYLERQENVIQVFNRLSRILTNTQRMLNELQAMVGQQATTQKLVERLCDIFGNPAYLVDASFKVLAIDRRMHMRELSVTWKRLEDEGYLSLDLISNLIRSNELRKMESEMAADIVYSKYFYTPFINCNLRHDGKIQGHLFIVGMLKKITEGELELASIVSEIVMQSVLGNYKYQNKRGQLYEHFMKDFLDGTITNKDYIVQQIPYLNLKPNSIYVVGKIVPSQMDELMLERIVSRLETNTNVRAARYENYVMGLFLIGSREELANLIDKLSRLSEFFACEVGISDCFENIYEIPNYALQASKAIILKNEAGIEERLSQFRDYALYDLLEYNRKNAKVFCATEIMQLADHDKKHNTQYMETLYAYLSTERGVMETAQILNIHRNTLGYRIDRMKELFHLELENPITRYRYFLSLIVLKNHIYE